MDIKVERTLAAINAACAGRPLYVVRARGTFAGNPVDVRMEFRTETARDRWASQWHGHGAIEVQVRNFTAAEIRAALGAK